MKVDINLLGPFANVYKTELAKFKEVNSSNLPKSNRANFEALHKKKNCRFLQDDGDKRKSRQTQITDLRKQRRSQRFMETRLPNMVAIANDLNVLIHEEGNEGEISAVEPEVPAVEDGEKESIEKPVKDEAKTINVTAKRSAVVRNEANVNKTDRTNGNFKNNVRALPQNNNKTGPPPPGKDSRREQLLKWKKEKEAVTSVARRNQKQPFKAGMPPPTAPSTNAASSVTQVKHTTTLASSTFTFSVKTSADPAPRVVNKPAVSAASTRNGQKVVNGPGPKLPNPATDARRVTRAMTKAQAPGPVIRAPAPRVPPPPVPNQGVKPALQKFKDLKINEKPKPKPATTSAPVTARVASKPAVNESSRVGQSSVAGSKPEIKRGPTSKPQGKPGKNTSSSQSCSNASKSTNDSTNSSSQESSSSQIEEPTPKAQQQEQAPVKVKKLKPKAIDSTYIDYNSKFSTACAQLGSYASEWNQIVEATPDIPDKVQGDIRSSLGKVKLLLESKLPQFGQLLFCYLCPGADPDQNAVIPCDLQGWWDVVSIQLDAVDEIFKDLRNLKERNWETAPEPKAPTPALANISTELPPRRPPVPKVKAQASGGLKAFLAKKRQMLQNPNGNSEETEPTTENATENQKLQTPIKKKDEASSDKTFEGGFFSICSPKACITPGSRRVLEIRQSEGVKGPRSPLRSPVLTRRSSSSSTASLRRMSMCILGVRKSLGSLSKIGVSPNLGLEDDRQSLNSSMASYTTTLTSQEEDEMTFCNTAD